MEPHTQVIYDGEVSSRSGIDAMEEAIRTMRMTALDRQGPRLATRRCNALETASYMSLRFTLLRWISAPPLEGEEEEFATCRLGNGLVLRCRSGPPSRATVVLVHSDNDGTLPVATPPPARRGGGKRAVCQEEDDEPRGRGKKGCT